MPLGYDSETDIVAIGDTATLRAYLDTSHGQYLDPSDVLSVIFNIQSPDGTRNPYQGIIQDDGGGYYQFNETNIEGHYVVVATFSLADGAQKSTRASSFEVQDPYTEPMVFPTNEFEAVAQGVWAKIEDVFDSNDGGPWLREMTERYFNPSKMASYINEAIMDFNFTQPTTTYVLNDFALSTDYVNNPNPMMPLIIQGTMIVVIRHLMRSYVEQPLPQGGQVSYEDRRDYQQRWKEIYDIEYEVWKRWVSFAKRGVFGFGKTSQSLFSYSRGLYSLNYRWPRGFFGWR